MIAFLKKIFLIIFGIFMIFIFFIYFYFESEIKKPFKIIGQEKVFEIKKGERTRDIAKNLQKEDLIKSSLAFLFYTLKTGEGRNLLPGKYCLSQEKSIKQIIEILMEGPAPQRITLTFPEGWRISEIEKKLVDFGLLKEGEIENLKIKDFKDEYFFLEDAPEGASLEGFLFPDTYFFECKNSKIICEEGKPKIIKCEKENLKKIINKFLSNFDQKLTPEMKIEIKNQKKKIYEIIILASILEKEVQTFEDRQIVSGILKKRLEKGLTLDVDATLAYILKEKNWTFEEMRKALGQAKKIDSPYNTYKYRGLPPTPISNPGIDSIKAAIYPKDTEYFFYLTDPKTKKTIFSKTLQEQQENERRYFGE